MNSMETILFWIIWGVVSFWALKNFYFSYNKRKVDALRKASLGLDLSVLFLFLFIWQPAASGGKTGLSLLLTGNMKIIILFLLIILSIFLFTTSDKLLLKAGVLLQITASIFIFVAMISLMPDTFVLRFSYVAPIIAALLLLTGDVSSLLLWQQLELKERKIKGKVD